MEAVWDAFLLLRWAALAGAVAAIVGTAPYPRRWLSAAREVAIVAGAYVLYFLARSITADHHARAASNARRLVDLEKASGLFHEPAIQSWIIDNGRLVTLSNWIYIWGFSPFMLLVGTWLLFHRPDAYYPVRNALLLSGAVGLLFFAAFPVAPPRMVELGLVDTISEHSGAYRNAQPHALVNEIAAMPSLHFGWCVVVAVPLARFGLGPLRVLGFAAPVAMAFAVVATANHYIVDVVAGGVVSLAALAAVTYWDRREPGWLGPLDFLRAPRRLWEHRA
ncbi:MAG: phosphatase PAP2 family protein [Dehalococcoidia bacterium]